MIMHLVNGHDEGSNDINCDINDHDVTDAIIFGTDHFHFYEPFCSLLVHMQRV